MYNDFELGGYLAWTGYPRHRVFTDPRLPAYPRAFHALMGRGDLTRAEWDAVMDRYGVDSALLSYAGINRRLAWWDPARWALVYRQGDARVFVRRLPRHAALIAAREIPASFAFTVEAGTRTLPLGRAARELTGAGLRVAAAPGRSAVRAGRRRSPPARWPPTAARWRRRRAAWIAPAPPQPTAGWPPCCSGRGDAGGALDALDRALALSTEAAADHLRASRALALERLGRRSEARAGWLELAGRADTHAGPAGARPRRPVAARPLSASFSANAS